MVEEAALADIRHLLHEYVSKGETAVRHMAFDSLQTYSRRTVTLVSRQRLAPIYQTAN